MDGFTDFDDYVASWAELGHVHTTHWEKIFPALDLPPNLPKGPLTVVLLNDKGAVVTEPKRLTPIAIERSPSSLQCVKCEPVEYVRQLTASITHYDIYNDGTLWKRSAFPSSINVTLEDTLRVTIRIEFRDLGLPATL